MLVKSINILKITLRNVKLRTFRIVKLVLTSPVRSESNERFFSRLKLVYNYLRTKMTKKTLNSLLKLILAQDMYR